MQTNTHSKRDSSSVLKRREEPAADRVLLAAVVPLLRGTALECRQQKSRKTRDKPYLVDALNVTPSLSAARRRWRYSRTAILAAAS